MGVGRATRWTWQWIGLDDEAVARMEGNNE